MATKFTNSSLATYKNISPNRSSGRQGHKIDTISIHCMAGDLSVQACGQLFAKSSTKASSNYGVDSNGKIGLYVEEKDRSWCTSSSSNDNRAVTIEVASSSKHPYKVNSKAYEALITLLVDICKRNDIKSLKWKGRKDLIGDVSKQNMTVHRWFANKACPGDYLYNRHGKIAKAVNERLGKDTSRPPGMPSDIEDDIIDDSNDGYDDDSTTASGGGVNIKVVDDTELALGNSSLASYINRIDAQNSEVRPVLISAITIHSAKSTGSLEAFAKMIKSSSTTYNYAIDSNGKIGLFVDEPYATNATKNKDNDNRSVNIACMNTSLDPDYEISDECYTALIDLCEDICRRRGIDKLEYDKKNPDISTLTLHSQFSENAKCPGNYIEGKINQITKDVNERLNSQMRKVSVTSWQADSEIAALRAQSTVSLGAINPYVATITETAKDINYEALVKLGVVGLMFYGGTYFDDNHKVLDSPNSKNIDKQITALEQSETFLPYGLVYHSKARNIDEAREECRWFFYLANTYAPKLGVWVRPLFSAKEQLAKDIIDTYYEYFVSWGFKSKCGIMASKDEAKMIGWPQQSSYMPLWLVGELDKGIAPKDEILTPSYFKLDSLKNKGYNADEDATRVATYVDRLKSQYGASGDSGSSTSDATTVSEKVDTKNHGSYYVTKVPNEPNYKGTKAVEHRTAVSSGPQAQMKNHKDRTVDKKGFSMWGGRYGIAVGSGVTGKPGKAYVPIGTYIDIILENGTLIPCVVFDAKSDAHTDNKYHMFTCRDGNGKPVNTWCCSEFTIEDSYYSVPGQNGNASTSYKNWNSKVKEFRVYKTNFLTDSKKK